MTSKIKVRYRSSEGQFWWSKSAWRIPKHPPKGPRGHQKQAKYGPRTLSRPSSAARKEQTRAKRVSGRIWKPFLVDLENPKNPQETPQGSEKQPKRAARHCQNHHWIVFFFFFFCLWDSLPKIKVFDNQKVGLGTRNRSQEAPKNDKKCHRTKQRKRGETKSINNDRKNSKNAWRRLTRERRFWDWKETWAVWSAEAPREPPYSRS